MGAPLQKKDFVSNQEVRWCPGCGDYAILSAMQKTLADLGTPREKVVFISGIGCSSRFPYYMNTYGFHTIHGRAPAFATGLAITRPDLSIWVISGDGDGLSIGGNHLIHALRRNLNLKILIFNNQTYGLTKGQYSPTSHSGTISKSSPGGSIDRPFQPLSLALGAGATFIGRTYDKDQRHMSEIFKRAAAHRGTACIEIYQNCVIFNDGVFENVVNKDVRLDKLIYLEDKKPLIFGKERQYALSITDLGVKKALVSEIPPDDIHLHDERDTRPAYPFLLSQLSYPDFPEVMGVLKAQTEVMYEEELTKQSQNPKQDLELKALLHQGDLWEVH